MRIATRILIAAGVAGTVAAAAAQTAGNLERLTVPADRLSPGCRLNPETPKVLLGPQGPVVILSGEPVTNPTNPWRGNDRRTAAAIRRQIEGPTPEPDGPPLDAAAASAFMLRWADHVVEAYGATYLADDNSPIRVYAVRFDDATRAAAEAPAGTTTAPRGASTRVVLGPTVVRVISGTRSRCFEAISEYVRSLR